MGKTYSNKSNSKNKKKKINKGQKKTALKLLCGVVLLSIVLSLVFGLKLYAFGKDVTVIYSANGGSVSKTSDVVEVCKGYTLVEPTHSDREFLYWSTDGKESGKVETSGIWLVTTKSKVILYAVWGEESGWTGNY